jgi:hypothetical protein
MLRLKENTFSPKKIETKIKIRYKKTRLLITKSLKITIYFVKMAELAKISDNNIDPRTSFARKKCWKMHLLSIDSVKEFSINLRLLF